MNREPEITVIVVSYNTKDLLLSCLKSVYESRGVGPIEIIMVDNGSTDGSVEAVQSLYPDVEMIKAKGNLGFSGANNLALPKVGGRYVLLLNSDAELRKDSLEIMKAFFDEHPDAGAVGPRLVYDDGTTQPSVDSFPNLFTEFLHLFQVKRLLPGERVRQAVAPTLSKVSGQTVGTYFQPYLTDLNPRPVDCLSAACLMVRRETAEAAGPLDEKFFMYMEDMDWCIRIRQTGTEIYYLPEVEVIHRVGMSGEASEESQEKVFVERYRSRLYFFKKHRGPFAVFMLRVMMVSAFAIRWPFSKKRRLYGKVIRMALAS